MIDRDDQLLAVMARRNRYILASLVLISLLWHSAAITQGVLAGGLLVIVAYGCLYRSLVKVLTHPDRSSARGFQLTYFLRLAALAAVVFLLISKGGVNPVALAAGMSVVVINIFWTAFRRMF